MVTLAIWGEVTPGAILTKCSLWVDMVDVITCAIFGDCRLRGVGVVRGVSLLSPIDLRCRPYNTGHTNACDCVIMTCTVLRDASCDCRAMIMTCTVSRAASCDCRAMIMTCTVLRAVLMTVE